MSPIPQCCSRLQLFPALSRDVGALGTIQGCQGVVQPEGLMGFDQISQLS